MNRWCCCQWSAVKCRTLVGILACLPVRCVQSIAGKILDVVYSKVIEIILVGILVLYLVDTYGAASAGRIRQWVDTADIVSTIYLRNTTA